MPLFKLAFLMAAASGIAYFSMPYIIQLAHRFGAVDQPDQRKVHNRIMPRLGGLGIFSAFFIILLFGVQASEPVLGIMFGGLVIFLVGVLDDLLQLPAGVKLLGQ